MSHWSNQFRIAERSPRCIVRRKVLVSPRGPFFLASRITTRGNSGVLFGERSRPIRREFRPSNKGRRSIYPPLGASPPLVEGPSGLVSPYRGSWIFLPTMTRVSVTLSRHAPRCQFWGWSPASSWDGRPPVLGVVARQFNDMHGRRIILPRQALHRMQQRVPTSVVTL